MERKDALIQALNQNIYGGKGPQTNSSSSADKAEELQKALNDAIGIMPGKKTSGASFQRQTTVETARSVPKAPSATTVSAAAAYSDFQTRNLFDDDIKKWMGAYQATHDANFGKRSKEDKTAAIYNNITQIEDTYTPRAVQTERAGLQPTVGLPGVGQVPRYEMPSVDYATVRNLWDATQDQLAYVLYSGEFTEAEAQAIADRLYSVKHQYDQIQANKSSGKTVSSGGFSGGVYLGDTKEKDKHSSDINWRYGETAEEFMQEFRYQNAIDGNRYNRRWAYATREQLPYMTIDQVIDTAVRRKDDMGIVALGYLAGVPVTQEQYNKIMAAADTAYKQGQITERQAEALKLERKSAGTKGNPQLVNQALSYYGNNGTLETSGEGIGVGSQIGRETIFDTAMGSANQILTRGTGYVNEAIGGVLDMMGFDVGKDFVARGEEQQRYTDPKLRASQQYQYNIQRDYGDKVQGIDSRIGRWFANAVPGLVSSIMGMAASSVAGGYITNGAVPIPVVDGTERALNATDMAAGYRAMNYGLKNAGLFAMAGNAALNTYGQKFADEQLDEGQRIRYALADGAAEFFTEKLFGGNPLLDGEETGMFTKLVYKLTGSGGYDSVAKTWLECIKDGAWGALAQKLVSSEAFDLAGEGLEEVLSSVGMMAMDYATYGQSDTTWESLGNDFATGLLLSLIMTGGQKMVQLAAPVDEEGNLKHIKYFTGEQQISRDAMDAQMMAYMIQYFAGDSQILRANGLSERETGKMLREYDRIRQEYTQITRYMDKAESGIGAEELIRQAKPVLGDVDARYFTMETALEDANDVLDAWDKAEAAVENYGSIAGVNASVARLATVENSAAEVNQTVERTAPAVQVEQTAENNKTPAQAVMPVQTETIGQQGTQVEPVGQTTTEGENENGESEGIAVQQGRDPGVGADGQIGAVGESAEDAGRGQRSDAAEIIRAAAAEGTEKRSPQSYQIKGGSKAQTMTILQADAVERIESLRNVRDEIAADGGEVVFFTGKLEVWNQYTKRFDTVEGLRQETADGKVTYYVKADWVSKSAGMIYLHEDFHDLIAKNRWLLLDMVDQLTERLGADGVESLVQKYITAYRGIYGVINDNMTSDEIADLEMIYLEEILADVYGGIRRGNINISEAVSVIEDSRGAIDRAKQNRRAMESRNGPNGQRYSVEDEVEELNEGYRRSMATESDQEQRAAEIKAERAKEASTEQLQNMYKSSMQRLSHFKWAQRNGVLAEEMAARMAKVEETLKIQGAELETRRKEAKERRERERLEEAENQRPIEAKKTLKRELRSIYSIPSGEISTANDLIERAANKIIQQGKITNQDKNELLDMLYSKGIIKVGPNDYYGEIRSYVAGGRVYVPEALREEFGDDWNDFRKRAFGSKLYLTDDSSDMDTATWLQDLAQMFPGGFSEEMDLREGLEQIVKLAEEGRAENLTLAEMMRRNKDEYGWSIEEQMEDMENRAEQALRDFGRQARLEVDLRRESAYKQIQQRNRYREMMEREARNRKESQKRNEVMHQIQQLSKMRNRTAPEIKDQIDQILHGIDTVARSISEAGLENLQLLAEKYNMAKDDPNFIPNPYVENRLMRLQQTQLNDMEIEDVVVLGRTINALVHSIQTANKLLGEQRSEEISEAAKMAIEELKGSKGTDGGKMFKWAVENHLSPVRFMKMLGGWRTDGMFTNLALDLERGQTRQLRYQEQATRLFDRILEDPRIKAWLPTAAGKDAKWITVDVPTGVGKTEKGAKIEFTKLHITPMMRVSLYLHSLNGDNLRHIEGGGVTVPDMELYKKGRLKDAYAKGTRVKMMPETVRAIVKGMTAEEKQFAKVLDTYYNRFSKDRINEVSMLLDGFERAGGDHYYHINTDKNFLAAQPESVQKNISLESIGSIVNERVHAQTPILLEDASTALTDHIDQISKYYGMTIPIRDFNAIMNYTVHSQGVGNAYSTSTKEVLGQKWGSGAQQYLNKLLADLQGSTSINDMAATMLSNLRGKLAGASLSFNPAVAWSQVASYPGAMQVLGPRALIQGLKAWEKVDTNLIAKYSPLYWYRNQGNSTEELGDYMKAKTLEQKLPYLLNWIQKMDSLTVRRLWAASEYYVRNNTDLQPGSQAEIDAGTDEFYTKVAEVFNRAVYDTQPNYTVMQKAQISRTESDLVKALTMFKTVPLQYYNMAFEAVETYRAAKARGNKTETATARKYLQRTVAGLLTANVLYVGIKAIFKALRGKGDRYKHEDGSWDVLSILEGLGLDLAETFAGSLIGGAEALDFAEKLIGTIADGKYSRFNAGEISALGLVEDVAGSILNLGAAINKGDGGAAAAALLDEAKNIATAYGIPIRNAESYLAAAVKGAWPTGYAVYNNLFDEVERSDLSKESGDDLDAAISVLMDNRTDDLTDDVVEELARLWKDGRKNALPSGIPASVKIDGEDKVLTAKEKTQYRDQWSQIVSGALPMLMATEEYLGSDDLTRSKLLNRLYDYADQKAKTGLGVAADKWVQEIKGEVTEGILYTQLRRGLDRKAEHEQITMAISNIISHDAGGVSDDNAEELARLYAAGYSSLLPQETPDKISYTVDGVTVDVDLTDQQRDKYRQTYQDVVGTALDRLMMSSSYAEADDKGRAALVQKMWRFAAETAKNDVVPEYEVDKWIADGYTAMEDGIPLDEYITYRADKSKITGQEDGESVDGLANKRTIDLINDQPWTDEQKQAAYRATLSDTKKFDDLDKAGLSWSQMSKVMSVQGSDKDRLKIIGKLGLPEAKTQAAAMVYATDAQKRMITTGSKLGVKTADYIEVLSNADSNGSGSISSDEATTYIMSMGLSPQQSAYLWQMATGSKSAKNNPFSKTFGWDFVDRLPD